MLLFTAPPVLSGTNFVWYPWVPVKSASLFLRDTSTGKPPRAHCHWVESTLGQGSTFRMELPARAATAGAT